MGNVSIFKGNRALFLNSDGFEHIDGRLNIYVDATPEGSVTAPVGSIANDRTNAIIYYKQSGAGNTGWVPFAGAVPVMKYQGAIAVNTDFPLIADVQNGWFYTISANVTDNAGAMYTNTGQSFTTGQEICWNGASWTLITDENEYRYFGTVANAEAATGQDAWICYVEETETFYRYEAAGAGYTDDNEGVLSTGDGGNTRWIAISGRFNFKNIRDWATGQVYAIDDLTINNSTIYRCNTGHTAGATFAGDIANWDLLYAEELASVYGYLAAEEIDGAGNAIDTDISLYTVSASTYTRPVNITATNRNNAVVRIRIAHVDGAIGAVANEDYLDYDIEMQPYESKEITIKGMEAADTILVRSDTTDVNFIAEGQEFSSDGAKRLAAVTVVADTNTALYVATGNVDEIEIVACNKDSVNSANIRIALIDGALGTWADEHNLRYEEILLKNESVHYSFDRRSLRNTHTIGVRSTNANVNFIFYGKEL